MLPKGTAGADSEALFSPLKQLLSGPEERWKGMQNSKGKGLKLRNVRVAILIALLVLE